MSRPAWLGRFLIPLGALALLVVLLAVGIKHSPEVGQIASPLINKPAPVWDLPSLTDPGRRIGSKDLRGRWYVLNVWGTWCVECRVEHPVLLEVQKSGVPIVGIDWNDQSADALEFLAKLGNPYSAVGVDQDGRAAVDWGVYGAPETFLVNPDGIVVHKQVGALTPEVWAKEFATRLPPSSPGRS